MNHLSATCILILATGLLVGGCSKEPSLRDVDTEDLIGVSASARFSGSWCFVDQENESVVTLVLGEDRSAHLHLSTFNAVADAVVAEGAWVQRGNLVEVDLGDIDLTVQEVDSNAIRVDGLQTLSVDVVNSPTLHRQHP